jgi:hypothetical protein
MITNYRSFKEHDGHNPGVGQHGSELSGYHGVEEHQGLGGKGTPNHTPKPKPI